MTNQNPLGLDGLDFIEYCSPKPQDLETLFLNWGFKKVAKHKTKEVFLFRQGDINFLLNCEKSGFAAEFAKKHGPSICSTGFRVQNAKSAHQEALKRGARAYEKSGSSRYLPAIYGIGDSLVHFVDQYGGKVSHFTENFSFLGADPSPKGFGMQIIDHLTNNVPRGEMDKWCQFYESIFNFREARYFDIRGAKTGLLSKVMRSPCGKFSIPINEPTENKSQIQEYLDEYHGSGIQHVALLTENIISSIESLRDRSVAFLDVPETYYEMIHDRVPNVTEDMSKLAKNKILVDGDKEGYLLQIFSQNLCGPIFYEVIQRKNHFGFGEGNFQALFDAIERDQQRRGYL